MLRLQAILLFLLAPLPCGASEPADAKKVLQELQGTWQVVGVGAFTVVVEGERAVLVVDGRRDKEKFDWSLKLDVTAKPWAVDVTPLHGDQKGKVFQCSFKLDGDYLEICGENEPGKKRPKEFRAIPKSNILLVSMQRLKQ